MPKDRREEMRLCYIQDVCPKYASRGAPPNNDIRNKYPCDRFILTDCEMYTGLHLWITGKGISCGIENKMMKGKK